MSSKALTILLVVVIYEILSIIVVGLVIKRQEKKAAAAGQAVSDDLQTAGGSIGWVATGCSLALALLGTVKIFGIMEMSWNRGAVVGWFSIATCFPLAICCLCFGRWMRRLRVQTVPELMGTMFGDNVRILALGLIAMQTFGILTMETQGLGIVFNALTGGMLKLQMGAILGGIFGILYVIIAGMKQAGISNTINAIVMYIGIIVAAIIMGRYIPGGWDGMQNYFESVDMAGYLKYMGANPKAFGSYALSSILALTLCQSCSQMGVQSALSCKSEKDVKKALILAAPINGFFGLVTLAMGIAGRYMNDAGYLTDVTAKTAGTMMMYQQFPTWVTILLLAGFLGAILSTFAVTILGLGGMFTNNIYARIKPDATMKQKNLCLRVTMVIAGVIAICAASRLPQIINGTMWLFALLSPIFFMLIFGLFWKQSKAAAMITMVVDIVVILLYTFTPVVQLIHWPLQVAYTSALVSGIVGAIAFAVCKGDRGYMVVWKEKDQARKAAARANA